MAIEDEQVDKNGGRDSEKRISVSEKEDKSSDEEEEEVEKDLIDEKDLDFLKQS
jgi:hypothetical protein